MCGIFGVISETDVFDELIESLTRLEYRGYDSAGISIQNSDGLVVQKSAKAPHEIEWKRIHGNIGIGHTRWATHGGVLDRNAHPHIDCSGEISVVHNGTLNDFREMREDLRSRGHQFRSDTDTEVISHLIEEYSRDYPFEEAVRNVLNDIDGSYAIAVMNSSDPGKIVAARNSSPLVLGLGSSSMYVSSDVPSLASLAEYIIPLGPDEMTVLERDRYRIFSKDGSDVSREPIRVNGYSNNIEEDGSTTFTEREIFEQPERLRDCSTIPGEELAPIVQGILDAGRLYICGAGTSYHAGLSLSYLLKELGIPSETVVSSEFPGKAVIDTETTTIFLSQSGSTADTNMAVAYAKENSGRTLGIVNVMGSDMERLVDYVAYTRSGPEFGVASTKNYSNQLYLTRMIGLELMERLGFPTDELKGEFEKIPEHVNDVLESYGRNQYFWGELNEIMVKDPMFIGSGFNYPTALEGALKLKELSYLNAAAYPSGELKHGPLALIEDGTPVIAINPRGNNSVFDRTRINMEQVRSRGGYGIVLTDSDEVYYDTLVSLPEVHYWASPIIYNIPLQLLAFYVSQSLGRNIDQPRNLAKSVTVQ